MNPFQLQFFERLQAWNLLRSNIADLPPLDKCVAVDSWWQRAPLVNHYLHIDDIKNWPDPWTLLSDNEYCLTARALGMAYTLTLLGIHDYQLCEVTDSQGDDYIIIRCANYTMNWHPNSVVNTPSSEFTVKRIIDTSSLLTKIK